MWREACGSSQWIYLLLDSKKERGQRLGEHFCISTSQTTGYLQRLLGDGIFFGFIPVCITPGICNNMQYFPSPTLLEWHPLMVTVDKEDLLNSYISLLPINIPPDHREHRLLPAKADWLCQFLPAAPVHKTALLRRTKNLYFQLLVWGSTEHR